LGLAFALNDAARKTILGLPITEDERQQLDDLPDYVVRLDDLLGRLKAQDFIKVRQHEGLQLLRQGDNAPPLNQAPAAERQKVQEAIQAVAKVPADEKA